MRGVVPLHRTCLGDVPFEDLLVMKIRDGLTLQQPGRSQVRSSKDGTVQFRERRPETLEQYWVSVWEACHLKP